MKTHDEMVELVFNLPRFAEIDFDVIDGLSDSKLREILRIPEPGAPVERKNNRGRKPKPFIRKPERVDVEFVDREGALFKKETWRKYSVDGRWADDVFFIRCGARVMWEGRSVSAGLVLHWLRTGERLPRLSKPRKPFKAAVRVGAKVKHLGYFASKEEREAAVLMYRLNQPIANPLGDK